MSLNLPMQKTALTRNGIMPVDKFSLSLNAIGATICML